MDKEKRARLEAKGWKVGSVEEFLGMTPDEAAYPRRWDLDRLAKIGTGEDRELAEQGLAEWADALDREDHS